MAIAAGGARNVIELSLVIDWAVCALVAFGAAFVALRYFKLSPLWALAIGMLVFTGLNFPIPVHTFAAKVAMPR